VDTPSDRPPYAKWVGVLLGVMLDGSAHFISGSRAAGVVWFFGLNVCGFASLALVVTPGIPSFVLGVMLLIGTLVLWLVMLFQSYRPIKRIGSLGWCGFVVVALVLNAVCAYPTLFVQAFKVPTGSMSPTIMPGDRLVVETLTYKFAEPQRGDIVVFATKGIPGLREDTSYIKRVAGVPGDRIRIEPPNLVVNDTVVSNQLVSSGFAGFKAAYAESNSVASLTNTATEIVLGTDEYYVLGDNTPNSLDSRYWGPLPRSNIVGRPTRIFWPPSRIGQSLGKTTGVSLTSGLN